MFGNHKVDNYHPDFIVQLVKFANRLNYPELIQSDKKFVLELAEKWPSNILISISFYSIHSKQDTFDQSVENKTKIQNSRKRSID